MNMTSNRTRTVALMMVSIVTVLFVAVTWAAAPLKAQKLRAAVEQSIRKLYPHAKIDEIEIERRIVRLIEVSVIENGREHDLTLTQDGTILSIAEPIDPDDLPAAVRDAVRKVAGKAKIEEAERIKVLAKLGAAPEKKPRFEYEAKFRKKGKEHDVIVSEDGSTIKTPKKLRIKEHD